MIDALVIGGGPAGASTAFQLARRGITTQVLDRARFPRAKPCAECLSPQASRILHDMGALDSLLPRGAQMRGMVVRAPAGVTARGDYAAPHGFTPFRQTGLAIRREILDEVLLARARHAGADVEENARVVDLLRATDGRVTGAIVARPDGTTREIRARYVIGADGLRSIVAHRLGLARSTTWPRRLAVVAHFHGIAQVSDCVELHVERDGFVGIADVGSGVTSVAAVFPIASARRMAGDPATFLTRWLGSKPQLSRRFERAERDGSVATTGPFASRARRAVYPGAALVGDAADFFDPFTGEGIYAALRGGELVADALAHALEWPDATEPLVAYEDARQAEFSGKWKVEWLIGVGVASPFVMNRATRALARDKRLADLLAGVTGDFVPARAVLRPGYLARLFLGTSASPNPLPRAESAPTWR